MGRGSIRQRAVRIGLVIGLSALSQAATPRPCDIYENAGTPCVAAHSTTRALFATYNGPLYQVRRSSDGSTQDIGVRATGDYANAGAQDSFCANTSCIITRIFDQSPRHNDLTIEGTGAAGAADVGAPADALPVTAGGHQVYGVSISAGMGYRNDAAAGVAVNGQPEGIYMVTSGTHVNDRCCFDYGNAEVSNTDTGNGHMDAINFSSQCWSFFGFGGCWGAGPWVQADLENGLFQSNIGISQNPANTGTAAPFVTALLKNDGHSFFALKGANARAGGLTTVYAGSLPTINGGGYAPMRQEGAIVLGTGGDNSNGSIGSFFEGAMTAGLPSDAAADAVQANIVSVGYGGPTGNTGTLTPASEISLRATTACCTSDYLRHQFFAGVLSPISSSSSTLDKEDATWIVRRGFAQNSCLSLESKNYPGYYLRHFNFKLFLQPYDGSAQFAADSTFCPVPGMNGQGVSLRSLNFPDKYIRHFFFWGFIASEGGSNSWDTPAFWRDDASWVVSSPWAP
jgi:hypothetical protein